MSLTLTGRYYDSLRVRVKETPEGSFHYLPVGSEDHGRRSYILWIPRTSLKYFKKQRGGEYDFPGILQGFKVEKGVKDLKLVPAPGYVTAHVLLRCGYRGSAKIHVVDSEPDIAIYPYRYYESERGSLGISAGAFISFPEEKKIKLKWERTGRLYGEPSEGTSLLSKDGLWDAPEDMVE